MPNSNCALCNHHLEDSTHIFFECLSFKTSRKLLSLDPSDQIKPLLTSFFPQTSTLYGKLSKTPSLIAYSTGMTLYPFPYGSFGMLGTTTLSIIKRNPKISTMPTPKRWSINTLPKGMNTLNIAWLLILNGTLQKSIVSNLILMAHAWVT